MKNLQITKKYTYGNGFTAVDFKLANGDKGTFRNSSVSSTETRYTLEIENSLCAMWGTMLENTGLSYALFNGQEPLYPALKKAFGVPCETERI